MSNPSTSILKVRRSICIAASPDRVWEEFTTFDRMDSWWGAKVGDPKAGTSQGQWLIEYEPRIGGRVVMAVEWDGTRASYGGAIEVCTPGRELTFENDWIPNRGWNVPTLITLMLSPALGGTLVEMFHHGFEHVGGDISAEHAGYEGGWGMTQLNALKRLVEMHL